MDLSKTRSELMLKLEDFTEEIIKMKMAIQDVAIFDTVFEGSDIALLPSLYIKIIVSDVNTTLLRIIKELSEEDIISAYYKTKELSYKRKEYILVLPIPEKYYAMYCQFTKTLTKEDLQTEIYNYYEGFEYEFLGIPKQVLNEPRETNNP